MDDSPYYLRVSLDGGAGGDLGSAAAHAVGEVEMSSPTPAQHDALVGTSGVPGAANPYVTSSDPRLGAGLNRELAAALATLDPAVNPCVSVAGLGSAGDQGGGTFLKIAAGAPDNVLRFASSNPAFDWVRDLQGTPLDVRAAGAKGDGVADDTAAIQACVDVVAAQGGGTVWLPPGQFKITAPITVKNGVGQTGLKIVGQSHRGGEVLPTRLCSYIQPLSGANFTVDSVIGGVATLSALTPASGSIDAEVIGKWFQHPGFAAGQGYFRILSRISGSSITVSEVNDYGSAITAGAKVGTWRIPHKNMIEAQTRETLFEGLVLDCVTGYVHGLMNVTQDPAGLVSTANIFRDMQFTNSFGGGVNMHGVVMGDRVNGGAYPFNCSEYRFDNCLFSYAKHSLVYQPNTTGQGKAHVFTDCAFAGASDSGLYPDQATLHGIYMVYGSFGGRTMTFNSLYSYAMYLYQADDEITILNAGAQSEGCRRFLYTGQFGTAQKIHIIGGRYDLTELPVDGYWIRLGSQGPLILDGLSWDPVYKANFKIAVTLAPIALRRPTVITRGCTFPCATDPVIVDPSGGGGPCNHVSIGDCYTQATGEVYSSCVKIQAVNDQLTDLAEANVADGVGELDLTDNLAATYDLYASSVAARRGTIKLEGWLRQNTALVMPDYEVSKRILNDLYGDPALAVTIRGSDAAKSVGVVSTSGRNRVVQVDPTGYWTEVEALTDESAARFDPLSLAPEFWMQSERLGVGIYSDVPDPMPDVSGKGRNATKGGAAGPGSCILQDPSIMMSAPWNWQKALLPAAQYGDNNWWDLPGFDLAQPFSVFFIGDICTGGGLRAYFGSLDVVLYQQGADIKCYAGAWQTLAGAWTAVGLYGPHVVEWYVNGAASEVIVNREAAIVHNPGAGGFTVANPIRLAQTQALWPALDLWYGRMGEFGIVAAPTPTQRAAVRRYLLKKWRA